jgi:hypothetical protein
MSRANAERPAISSMDRGRRMLGSVAALVLLAAVLPGCSSARCGRETFGGFTCQQVLEAARRDVGINGSNSVVVVDVPPGESGRTAPDVACVVEVDSTGARTLIVVGLRSIDPDLHAWVVDGAKYSAYCMGTGP